MIRNRGNIEGEGVQECADEEDGGGFGGEEYGADALLHTRAIPQLTLEGVPARKLNEKVKKREKKTCFE